MITSDAQQLSAAVIAGGRSRRFGSPKALQVVGGLTLLQHSLNLAGALAAPVYLSVATENFFPDCPVPQISDEVEGRGPAGGIAAVLQRIATPWLAVLPCDMPLLNAAVYRLLWSQREPALPVVACSDRGMEPLVSLWPKSAAAILHRSLQEGEFSLHRILANFPSVNIDVPALLADFSPDIFRNINTPQDARVVEDILMRRGNAR